MVTTIQISSDLLKNLKKKKIHEKESYEEIIWNLIEDTMELNEETKRDIEKARAEIKAGKFHTHEQVKKHFGL
jgi:predicted transcriptional regulator